MTCKLTFVSSFIFRRKVGFLNSRLILGAKQQVVLIYRDFISWQECFRMAALYLLPPAPGHVGIPSSVFLMSEHKLMFSIKPRCSELEAKRLGNLDNRLQTEGRWDYSEFQESNVKGSGFVGWFRRTKAQWQAEPRQDTNHAVRQRPAAGHLNRMMQRQENCRLGLQKSYPAEIDAGFV